jgi:hypothetical protein
MGLIVGSLFTAVGNKYVTDGYLPLSNFNLSDKLHLLTIVLITFNCIICNCRATIEDQGQSKVGPHNVRRNPDPIHIGRSFVYYYGIKLIHERER